MKKRLFRKIAIVLVIAMLFTLIPLDSFIIRAYAEDNACFEDNRFVKSDGTIYIRIKDVTTKGAHIVFYEADPSTEYYWYNYQPGEDKVLYEYDVAFETVPDGFSDELIPDCIDECLRYYTGEGFLSFYLSPAGEKLYVRDNTASFDEDLEGEYWMVHHGEIVGVTTTHEKNDLVEVEKEEVVGDGNCVSNNRLPDMRIYPEPDKWREELEEPEGDNDNPPNEKPAEDICTPGTEIIKTSYEYDEELWGISLEEIADCYYVRLKGVSWVESSYVENDDDYYQYHNYDRLPWADGELCATNQDYDDINAARKELFEAQTGMITGETEMLFYHDSENHSGFAGLYIENGKLWTKDVTLSQGNQTIAYYYDNIDWCQVNPYSKEFSYYDEDNGVILLKGMTNPAMSDNGGIAYDIEYEIWLVFGSDGTVTALGNVWAYGEGTEVIKYDVIASAVEFQTNVEYELNEVFHKERITIDTYEEVDTGDCKVKERDRESVFGPIKDDSSSGDAGDTGDSGDTGDAGDTGDVGDTGDAGDGGDAGDTGDTGDAGDAGDAGDTGDTGSCPVDKPIVNKVITYETIKVPVVKTEWITIYNDWPDDTDPKDGSGRPEASEDITYGYNSMDYTVEGIEEYKKILEDEGAYLGGSSTGDTGESGDGGDSEDKVDPDNIIMLSDSYINGAYASSELSESSGVHYADYVVDNNYNTAWVEGVSGDGEMEFVTVYFTEEVPLAGFTIANGYFKSSELYNKNGKVNSLIITFDDGSQEFVDLGSYSSSVVNDDYSDEIIFDTVHNTASVTFLIEDASMGTKYDDTCISEIDFYIQE